ncbi:MAG: capsule assembly Wzi family protein [Fibrobacter sp.]|nr:capsule assembly Wzi family protein [Fibrobacter sp.]
MKLLLLITLLFSSVLAQEINLDRPYSLKTPQSQSLLQALHQQSAGDNLESHFPRRNSLWRPNLPINSMFSWHDDKSLLAISPVQGYNFLGSERLADTVNALEGGMVLRGYRDSVEFWLDARIYNEDHRASYPRSWDREFLEIQDSAINGALSYTSYARYRGNLSIHFDWARLSMGRDAAHWGPAWKHALVFNQNAIPFPQASLETQIGPLTVKTLYGDLNIGGHSMSNLNTRDRNLYAHRYELKLGSNVLLGISEATIVDSISAPILFVPIVPLFMHKGQMSEDYNNGLLGLDLAFRLPGWGRIYGEFMLDDMESPISLWENSTIEAKWGGTVGLHLIHDWDYLQLGWISEYARVEPYVYTHFKPNTAQVAHQGQPLGAPLGPNSQAIETMFYGYWKEKIQISLSSSWHWKGTDYGSALNDTTPVYDHHSTPKYFIKDAPMQWALSPRLAYIGTYLHGEAEITFGTRRRFATRIGLSW